MKMQNILASYDIHTPFKRDFYSNPNLYTYTDSKNDDDIGINNTDNLSHSIEWFNRNSFDSKEENTPDNGIQESLFDIINKINNDPEENERNSHVSILGKKRNKYLDQEEKAEPNKKSKNEQSIEEKDTKDTSTKIGEKNIKKLKKFITYFPEKEAKYKSFNYIKKHKGSFQKYLIKTSKNHIIREFSNESNQLKIEKNTVFTDDGNIGRNKANLSSKIIYFYPLINEDKRNKNKKEVILEELKDGELKIFLNKTLEEMYKEYYKTEKFREFSSNDDVKRFDAQLLRETKEKFSFLKHEGFIKFLKNEN